ncbi:hypothetical protein PR048_011027 [Dryococelus australis]|uniref:DDE-1 domain-containing protein n=1 Tax=Dryococelus australis TaxID=614101 RepID=A0ABQ9HKH3_9NEOP|nr:hypothetical protein PR048_011027 [Dryococelus australis]
MWFLIKQSEGVPLSGPILKAQAVKFCNDLHGNTRHGLSEASIKGEARSCDTLSTPLFPAELQKVTMDENLTDDQVYNCDKTALYFRLLPTKSQEPGFQQNKDRVTLLFANNKSGRHKLKPLCVGKSRSPRCFKHVNMKLLPVTYTHTKNAWMNVILQKFCSVSEKHRLSLKLEEKALLILDHCPAHPSADLLQSRDGKIKVKFLPKNATALIQPLDQGIIRAFKAYYRRELLSAIVNSEDKIEVYLNQSTSRELCIP